MAKDTTDMLNICMAPLDDPSYHSIELKRGIRCVVVRPFNEVRTDYLQRDLHDVVVKLELQLEKDVSMSDLESDIIPYMCNGKEKRILAIYCQGVFYQGCVVRYENRPLIFSNACILTGEDFTDLTMEQCYALVKSARAMQTDGMNSVSVNITKDMDMVPRVLIDDEESFVRPMARDDKKMS